MYFWKESKMGRKMLCMRHQKTARQEVGETAGRRFESYRQLQLAYL